MTDEDADLSSELVVCTETQHLHRRGQVFDPWHLSWSEAAHPKQPQPVSCVEAIRRLATSGALRRVPVAIIGPKEATEAQRTCALELARRLTLLGLTLMCGGRTGVMEAASRGCHEAGGMMIGIVPGDEWQEANEHVAIPIATGLGPARNAIIARAAIALIAVGGGHGTITEMAFGLHFSRLVLALNDAPTVPGAQVCVDLDEVEHRLTRHLLGLDEPARVGV